MINFSCNIYLHKSVKWKDFYCTWTRTWLWRTHALWWRKPAGIPPHCGSSCLWWRHSPLDLPCPGCQSARPRRPGLPSSCNCPPWWARSPPQTGTRKGIMWQEIETAGLIGNVVMKSHLVVHELQGKGRLSHSTAAHHDHLVESQRGLAFVLSGGHDSGLCQSSVSKLRPTTKGQQKPGESSRDSTWWKIWKKKHWLV